MARPLETVQLFLWPVGENNCPTLIYRGLVINNMTEESRRGKQQQQQRDGVHHIPKKISKF